tara:strand:+ start:4844 stop:5068 length:225 start_codon:yes stop_codon:yes gene_type:complete
MKRLCCAALQLLALNEAMSRILFLKTGTSLRVPQEGDGNHMKISIWLRLVASDEYRKTIAFALAASRNPHPTRS